MLESLSSKQRVISVIWPFTFIISFRMRWDSTKTAFFRTDWAQSLNRAYTCSVHGSNRFGNRTVRSPSAIIQFERTVSSDAFCATVKSSCRFSSLQEGKITLWWHSMSALCYNRITGSYQKSASSTISLQSASIAEDCRMWNCMKPQRLLKRHYHIP